MQQPGQYFQGDVAFIPVTNPKMIKLVESDGLRQKPELPDRHILVEGEATGHHHSVAVVASVVAMMASVRYLEILEEDGTEVTHQEHLPVHLPQGLYIVRRQREFAADRGSGQVYVYD